MVATDGIANEGATEENPRESQQCELPTKPGKSLDSVTSSCPTTTDCLKIHSLLFFAGSIALFEMI